LLPARRMLPYSSTEGCCLLVRYLAVRSARQRQT
jgi:hypothetical protein